MAQQTIYRVPRRFVTFPEDPHPYGLLAASFVGHVLCVAGALILSSLLAARLEQSKIYIVNLVPAAPVQGSEGPAPAPERVARVPEPARPAPATPKAVEKAPPRTSRPAPPPEPVREPAPPRPAEPAPPRVVAPSPSRAVEPPPTKAAAEAPARPAPLRTAELALPRRAEREITPTEVAARASERTLPPPPPVSPSLPPAGPVAARLPEPPPPPRIQAPSVAPAVPPAARAPSAKAAVDPIRLGQPTASGAATGSISLDVSDFPFTYYLRQIQAKIGERWTPPRAAAHGGERAVVLFEIERDGQVREPILERGSGNTLYDQSALRAVREASPFPPLPQEFKASSLRVHFGFEFTPEQG
jgi:TonB family protein